MSDKKQIEEMAKAVRTVFHHNSAVDLANGAIVGVFEEGAALELYDQGYRKQEWISVDERLPTNEGKYLVCTANGNIGVGNFIDYYGAGKRLCFDNWAVTHWMPLPEAPKGE
jgi:hypothetical protein